MMWSVLSDKGAISNEKTERQGARDTIVGSDVGLLLPGTKRRMRTLNCRSTSQDSLDFL